MANDLSQVIVAYDAQIVEVLRSDSGNKAVLLLDLWRLSSDHHAFAAAVVARLLFEHQLREMLEQKVSS